MSFFYNLNKKFAELAKEQEQSQPVEQAKTSEFKKIVEDSEKWIQKTGVEKNKGGLHRALHVPQGEKIPKAKIEKATHSKDAHLRHMAQFAQNVAKEGMAEGDMEEGNEFSGELAKAKSQHKDSFSVDGKTYPVKEEGMSDKEKSFAALAEPKDKITFADKIAGAKKEVDEMLGDVAADAMRNALNKVREIEHDDVEEGWDDMEKSVEKRRQDISKLKTGDKMAGHKHDIEKTATGMKVTRRVRPDGISVGADEEPSADGEKRGRGRPKGTGGKMGAKGPSGRSKLMTREDDEYDDEAGMAKQDLSQAKDAAEELRSILASDENLPEWVQAKITKAVDYLDTARDYIKSEKDGEEELDEKAVSKKQQRFMGMVHAAQKGEKPASKEVAKVAKDMKKKDAEDFAKTKHKGLPEKVKEEGAEKEATPEEDKPKKSKGGIKFGKGVYEELDSKLEQLITESMNFDFHVGQGPNGGNQKSLTINATDEDAEKLADLLRYAGIGSAEAPAADNASCPVCGESACGCEAVEEDLANSPNVEVQDTEFMTQTIAGGLNKPKSTGQTTTPVIASQLRRQVSMEESVELERKLFDLYKQFGKS